MDEIIVDIWLRDVFGKVTGEPIIDYEGFTPEQKKEAERQALDDVRDRDMSDIFYIASDLYKINYSHGIVNIIIPGLRQVYLNYMDHFNPAEKWTIIAANKQDLPKFVNIWDYASLNEFNTNDTALPEFQLFGEISRYDILHLSFTDFKQAINNNTPIMLRLEDSNVIISLAFKPYDFYDLALGTIVRQTA